MNGISDTYMTWHIHDGYLVTQFGMKTKQSALHNFGKKYYLKTHFMRLDNVVTFLPRKTKQNKTKQRF